MKNLKIYRSSSNQVLENLAFEEYLVANSNEDVLLFYINQDAVVIGKHQNPWKEVNLESIQKNNITLARRLSGGGTVYHDLGNINFSFIRNKNKDFVNFKEHIAPISQALQYLGIANHITERNDIFINDHKVSGNAEHVNNSAKRIIHHGTLLYDANIGSLGTSIKPKDLQITTHAVDSVRSPVMNMRSIKDHGDTNSFLDLLIFEISKLVQSVGVESVSPINFEEVKELVSNKYSTWEWTFGHTPQFTYTNQSAVSKIRKGHVIESSLPELVGLRCDKIIL